MQLLRAGRYKPGLRHACIGPESDTVQTVAVG
jgi:hypothetical protein